MEITTSTRMMTTEQACAYVGMGRTNLREWGNKIGAARKFGKSLRFDKKIIDEYLDNLKEAPTEQL